MQDVEIWKDIDGFLHKYQVSNLGRVRSFAKTANPKILKPQIDSGGYLGVNLYYEKYKFKNHLVHRLVASHFLENNSNKEMVNHIDGNKKNNLLSNLEWVTRSENAKHSFRIGLQSNKGSKHPRSKLNEDIVLLIKNDIKIGMKNSEIAKKYNCHRDTISQIKNNRQWLHVNLDD